MVEYFGPILITVVLMTLQQEIYGHDFYLTFNQKVGAAMLIGHYIKRELETMLVHKFSNATMPFFNIFKNSFHYYILCGFNCMYFFLHP